VRRRWAGRDKKRTIESQIRRTKSFIDDNVIRRDPAGGCTMGVQEASNNALQVQDTNTAKACQVLL